MGGTSTRFHSWRAQHWLARHRMAVSVIAALFILFLFPYLRLVNVARGENTARDAISDAFSAVLEAEKAGGDVTGLVTSLNEALGLVEEGERSPEQAKAAALYDRAKQIAGDVLASAPKVKEAGLVAQRNATILVTISIVALAVTALVAYLFVPRLFWTLWLRSHRGWRVEPR